MKILLIGSGAREHAIARALKKSPRLSRLYVTLNAAHPGLMALAHEYNMGDVCDIPQVVTAAKHWGVDFVIVGPEAPLAQGIADALREACIPVIGPTQKLARLEGSKAFTRRLMEKYRISGLPRYQIFHDLHGSEAWLNELGEQHYVIKADGLMGGKGVKVAGDHLHSFTEAFAYCRSLSEAKQSFVIEEKLIGQEFSLMSFCDGQSVIPMPLVQDHKRAFVHDTGPNTGGMGSYSEPDHRLSFLSLKDIAEAQRINEAVLSAAQQECGEPYCGILYGSFIATREGIAVIEFNCRFGDPEAMNVLGILQSDFVTVCCAMIEGNLRDTSISFAHQATVCKYIVPEGYPDHAIQHAVLDVSMIQNQDQLYLASVAEKEGKLTMLGSRAAAVLGIGNTVAEAENQAEAEVQRIQGPVFHRADIGTDSLIASRRLQMEQLRGVTS